MRRFFAKNLLFTIITNVLVMPAWVFLIARTVQNRVGPKDYGPYASSYSLSLVFAVILDFGITNYNTRTVSRNPDELKSLFPAMMTSRLILMLIYAVILLGIGFISGYDAWKMLLLAGILLIQMLLYTVQYLRSNVSALHHFKTDSILSVSGRLLMILICGFLLVYPATAHRFKIEWFVETQIVCYLLTAIACLVVLKRIYPIQLRFSFDGPAVLRIIKDSFPYALLIFLMSTYTRADQWLLEQLSGVNNEGQVNMYAAAYNWLDVGNMFALIFATILLPLFGRMLAEKQSVNQIVELCVNMLMPVSFMVAVGAAFYGVPIMHFLYTAATDQWGYILAWVMASFPCFCIMYIYSTLLTANGNLKTLNKLAIGGVIINLGLNIYLIPRQQAVGAAITGFATQAFMATGFIIACIKEVNLAVHIKRLLAHVGFLALAIGICYCTTLVHIHWMAQLGLFIVVCASLMFAFRFVSLQAIKQLLSNKQ